MKNVFIILLAVLFVAAAIAGLTFHQKYSDTKDTLGVSEKKILSLNEEVTRLNKEGSGLRR